MIAPVPAAPSPSRIAVLIDGDNVPRSFRPRIASEAAKLGNVVIWQLFGDIAHHSDWSREAGIDMHHCTGKAGSNAADIALVIGALDLAYRGLAEGFLIVSNDRDFEPLLRHLQKMGRSASILKRPTPPATKPKPAPTPAPKMAQEKMDAAAILHHVIDLIRTQGDANGLPVARLNAIHSRTGFRVSSTPEKQWRAWLKARPEYFQIDPKGPNSRVRVVKPKAGIT